MSAQLRSMLRCSVIAALVAVCLAVCPAFCEQNAVKLSVWGSISMEQAFGVRAQVAEFEQRNPGVHVSFLSMGAGTMNPQKLMTSVVGKVPPDIVNQDRFTIGDWASRSAFTDLTPLIKRDAANPDGVRPEDYYIPCWNEAVYKGGVFAIPNSTDARFLYFNKALFRQAGLDPNRPPRTWNELKDYTRKLTKLDRFGTPIQMGFIPTYGNGWFYLYAWQNGSEFMDKSGRRCTLDNPYSETALQYLVDIYRVLGGASVVDRFKSGFQNESLDPFLTGKVAMKIDVDGAANLIARYAPTLDFGIAPAPVPDERVRHTTNNVQSVAGSPVGLDYARWTALNHTTSDFGRFAGEPRYITWSGGFSWAIPVGSKHVELAWKFIKWMNSPESNLIAAHAQRKHNRALGGPYSPEIHANIKVNEAVFAAYASSDPRFRKTLRFALSMMPYSRYRPVTFVGQQLWDEHSRACDLALQHNQSHLTPKQALVKGTRAVQRELDAVFERENDPEVPLALFWALIVGAMLTVIVVLVIAGIRAGKVGPLMRKEAFAGFAFSAPWIIGFLVFTIGPIVASIVFSFSDYDVLHSARWVGLANYRGLFTYEWDLFSKALYNTVFLAGIGLPLGMMASLSIALLLNTEVKGMSWYRTVYYLPSIVPVVASAVLWMWVLNPDFGILNSLWRLTITQWFGSPSPGWTSQPQEFGGAKSALILMGLWGAGGGMIIWLAGLKGIPVQLYEAAELDGASVWAKFRAITLPMLSPYIFFNLIMGTIGVVQTFDTVYVMTGGGPADATLVPVMYLFSKAFRYFSMGYASAVAWIMFAIILVITVLQLKIAPRWVYYEAEKNGK